jgi:uncharacterized protein YbjQ (UPF0145 family)
MVIATLPELPGKQIEAVGMVGSVAHVAGGPQALEALRGELERQATELGADAVVDVRLQMLETAAPHMGPPRMTVALIGTAVRFV